MRCRSFLIMTAAMALVASVVAAAGGEAEKPAEAPPEQAVEASEAAASEAGSPQAPTVATQGLRVYRDPATGKLGPAPAGEELVFGEALETISSQSSVGLEARTLDTGAVAMDLQGRFMSVSVMTMDAEGQKSIRCLDSAEQAEQVLAAAQATEERDDE